MIPDRNRLHPSTRLTHSPDVPLPEGNWPILSPIFQTAKFRLGDEVPLSSQYAYTRVSNPTLRELELSLAELQKTEDCIVVASGMAAITGAILGLMKSGDHLITFLETYRPARIFTRKTLDRFGMKTSVLSLSDLTNLESLITPKTRIIYFESQSTSRNRRHQENNQCR
jgi:cystathionine beta-lyase/cystathionine gamma-synthase